MQCNLRAYWCNTHIFPFAGVRPGLIRCLNIADLKNSAKQPYVFTGDGGTWRIQSCEVLTMSEPVSQEVHVFINTCNIANYPPISALNPAQDYHAVFAIKLFLLTPCGDSETV